MSARPRAAAALTGIVHVHTNYSHDGKDSITKLRAACLERGIGFVGLTDHAEDLTEAKWHDYVAECAASSDARVSMIPGLEFRFEGHKGLHLLALGLSRWITPSTPEAFIGDARAFAQFSIAAHPILFRYRMPNAVAQGIDSIEVWNASYNTRFLPDPRAIRLLHRTRLLHPELVGVAGLDQHDSTNDRQTRVVLTNGDDAGQPLAALRAGRFENTGRTMRFDSAATMSTGLFAMLELARWAFDRVERVQDRAVRSMRRAKS